MTAEPPHSFAVYLEQVQLPAGPDGDWTQRVQVLLLQSPRGPEYLNAVHRWQQRPGHRAVWHQRNVPLDAPPRGLFSRVAAYTELEELQTLDNLSDWAMRPPVTVRVPAAELATIHHDRATPYKTLERVKRAAKRRHGFTV